MRYLHFFWIIWLFNIASFWAFNRFHKLKIKITFKFSKRFVRLFFLFTCMCFLYELIKIVSGWKFTNWYIDALFIQLIFISTDYLICNKYTYHSKIKRFYRPYIIFRKWVVGLYLFRLIFPIILGFIPFAFALDPLFYPREDPQKMCIINNLWLRNDDSFNPKYRLNTNPRTIVIRKFGPFEKTIVNLDRNFEQANEIFPHPIFLNDTILLCEGLKPFDRLDEFDSNSLISSVIKSQKYKTKIVDNKQNSSSAKNKLIKGKAIMVTTGAEGISVNDLKNNLDSYNINFKALWKNNIYLTMENSFCLVFKIDKYKRYCELYTVKFKSINYIRKIKL